MDIWLTLSLLLMFLGVLGTLLPVLPGISLSMVGLLILKITNYSQEISWTTIAIFAFVYLVLALLEYFLPMYTTKKYGGTRYGIIGLIVGAIIGIAFSPFGLASLFIMPFLGAFGGEYLYNQNKENAMRAAWGAFVGFALNIGVHFVYSLVLITYSIYVIYFN
ncbi:DUF456 domain-containing protein [Ornithobacterium rhinotracheale]|uniref:DUF456 domain-containing protein n=1 Tax=Ornithobacterium rhinotracheale (strain ATCC 51463 / DSM 15997 / CCUG 23171 / CIP 104009 / LMG 9086) TaxID=867902 RepID=I3ZZJ3_ORNRL|nr:DUF456 domain-containing protein [Ornithobacterium rhinotracheale]AFL97127.1 hypothetical protein Ornrh_0933 [Ornithobacterium rhinotracheale DSM 15997]AIP99231.1 membrane protein [Ornithobacterium rhinotracheale ORT-UMN 88]KGB67435.1 hypothetical protein Q787_05125 [Ornithobacterium rhinotracheale H06-030791]MCK0194352.1 DUF456 domain-containing protein [Ornithobacterium rhinotracheale]MCK0199883.1 DUF456 domain-containing protein [Ornithobacterium rhinotracheale]